MSYPCISSLKLPMEVFPLYRERSEMLCDICQVVDPRPKQGQTPNDTVFAFSPSFLLKPFCGSPQIWLVPPQATSWANPSLGAFSLSVPTGESALSL